jgi:pimeloyl-ACP methyl ester carboxylesterase
MSDTLSRSRLLATSAAVAAGALLSGPLLAQASPAKINIVLVHGAWSDGSGWSKVIPILQAAGHNVVAVQNQMLSLKADSENTRGMIDTMRGPTVVVGHSYGGAVITSAAYGARNITGLVYIAAFAPDEGESLGGISAKYPPVAGDQYIVPGPGGLLFLDRRHMPQVFAAELPRSEGAVLAAEQRPVAPAIFTDKMGPPAWKYHKTWFQISENDQMIPPDAERMMAVRAKGTTISLESCHASLVAHPTAVANLILRASRYRT